MKNFVDAIVDDFACSDIPETGRGFSVDLITYYNKDKCCFSILRGCSGYESEGGTERGGDI